MGLFGSIFSRKATPEAFDYDYGAQWVPGREYARVGGDMGDGSQVGRLAHQVRYTSPDAPGSVIEVCFYVVGRGDGTFETGIRYRYTTDDFPGWSYTGWDAGDWASYAEFGAADDAARHGAAGVAVGAVDLAADHPEIFDWEGEHFPHAGDQRDHEGLSAKVIVPGAVTP